MNKRDLIRSYRRMMIVVICLLPGFLILDNIMGENVDNVVKIGLFVLIGGLVVALIELIRYNRKKKFQKKNK